MFRSLFNRYHARRRKYVFLLEKNRSKTLIFFFYIMRNLYQNLEKLIVFEKKLVSGTTHLPSLRNRARGFVCRGVCRPLKTVWTPLLQQNTSGLGMVLPLRHSKWRHKKHAQKAVTTAFGRSIIHCDVMSSCESVYVRHRPFRGVPVFQLIWNNLK